MPFWQYCDRRLKFWKVSLNLLEDQLMHNCNQRWSRGHKARGHGHKKNPRPRPRTAFPRTDTLEAKDTSASAIQKKTSSQKFFRRSPKKNVFQKFFQALHKVLTIQKIVLSSSRGQAIFRGQGLDLRGQGLQIVSSRTPPLIVTFCFVLTITLLKTLIESYKHAVSF